MRNSVYLTLTDIKLSGWGLAHNRMSKIVIQCENLLQAVKLLKYVKTKPYYTDVKIVYNKPIYNSKYYHVYNDRDYNWI